MAGRHSSLPQMLSTPARDRQECPSYVASRRTMSRLPCTSRGPAEMPVTPSSHLTRSGGDAGHAFLAPHAVQRRCRARLPRTSRGPALVPGRPSSHLTRSSGDAGHAFPAPQAVRRWCRARLPCTSRGPEVGPVTHSSHLARSARWCPFRVDRTFKFRGWWSSDSRSFLHEDLLSQAGCGNSAIDAPQQKPPDGRCRCSRRGWRPRG